MPLISTLSKYDLIKNYDEVFLENYFFLASIELFIKNTVARVDVTIITITLKRPIPLVSIDCGNLITISDKRMIKVKNTAIWDIILFESGFL